MKIKLEKTVLNLNNVEENNRNSVENKVSQKEIRPSLQNYNYYSTGDKTQADMAEIKIETNTPVEEIPYFDSQEKSQNGLK